MPMRYGVKDGRGLECAACKEKKTTKVEATKGGIRMPLGGAGVRKSTTPKTTVTPAAQPAVIASDAQPRTPMWRVASHSEKSWLARHEQKDRLPIHVATKTFFCFTRGQAQADRTMATRTADKRTTFEVRNLSTRYGYYSAGQKGGLPFDSYIPRMPNLKSIVTDYFTFSSVLPKDLATFLGLGQEASVTESGLNMDPTNQTKSLKVSVNTLDEAMAVFQ